ncbi:hypothetical protein JK222_01325 [Gluconobacter cerinus]|uniref:HEPN domain-containing protein n=1 Tax=Gluconobacter cerinus TaxID=38307 RepID=UPI001B8D4255|nr:HEPN domain-containing protein [Gluconobacter cerinus]MBS1070353.1 hypothetical protein [Gluconobacter cerinus]
MKSPTNHYKTLSKSLNKAKKINNGINKISCRSDLEHLKLQSYVFLCHSALEQYIEDLGLAAAQAARTKFSSSGIVTKTLIALISSKLVNDISSKSRLKLSEELVSSIEIFSKEAFNRYRHIVQSNNGIKKDDQKNIFLPIGVDPEINDILLMNNLHSFGTKRGDVAHKFKVQRTDTLTSVETEINAIISNIIGYDKAVCESLKTRMVKI